MSKMWKGTFKICMLVFILKKLVPSIKRGLNMPEVLHYVDLP